MDFAGDLGRRSAATRNSVSIEPALLHDGALSVCVDIPSTKASTYNVNTGIQPRKGEKDIEVC